MTSHTEMPLDLLIIGGGIAGLWLLDEARRAGFNVLLVESQALGSGQTMASQGILHGGFKHALTGRISSHVDALNEMPSIWRQCLAGTREPDLREVTLRGESCHCWRTDSLTSLFGQLGARMGLRVGLDRVGDSRRPVPLKDAPGQVYQLFEQVIDPFSLVAVLAQRNHTRIVRGTRIDFFCCYDGSVDTALIESCDGQHLLTKPRHIVLAAGQQNDALRHFCGLAPNSVRHLPLAILTLRGNLPTLNGFCLDGTKAKVVITTQRVRDDEAVWQVASERVTDVEDALLRMSMVQQLEEALPGFAWPERMKIWLYTSTRAEAFTKDGSRANDVQTIVEGNVITAFPTKLVLAPRLAERILQQLPPPVAGCDITEAVANWPRPRVAPYPWDV